MDDNNYFPGLQGRFNLNIIVAFSKVGNNCKNNKSITLISFKGDLLFRFHIDRAIRLDLL